MKAEPPHAGRVRRQLRRALVADKWNVGVVDAPIEAFLAGGLPAEPEWLPERAGSAYVADPFGLLRDGQLTILLEAYDFHSRQGEICAMTFESGVGWTLSDPVFAFSVHSSFPYLFEHGGETYCLPDASHTGSLVLYAAKEFPNRWEQAATLLDSVPAVDPTLFEWDGRWWLVCGRQDDQPSSKLYCWWAPHLRGPWRPHDESPVKVGALGTRPAGTPFVHDGSLYRPAQDCQHSYGAAVVINRVTALSRRRFQEETVSRIDPDKSGPYPAGLHTLSAVGSRTLIDGKRRIATPDKLRWWLTKRRS